MYMYNILYIIFFLKKVNFKLKYDIVVYWNVMFVFSLEKNFIYEFFIKYQVCWLNGNKSNYRYGYRGYCDIEIWYSVCNCKMY